MKCQSNISSLSNFRLHVPTVTLWSISVVLPPDVVVAILGRRNWLCVFILMLLDTGIDQFSSKNCLVFLETSSEYLVCHVSVFFSLLSCLMNELGVLINNHPSFPLIFHLLAHPILLLTLHFLLHSPSSFLNHSIPFHPPPYPPQHPSNSLISALLKLLSLLIPQMSLLPNYAGQSH